MSRSATPNTHYIRSLENQLSNTVRLESKLNDTIEKYDSKIADLTQLIQLQHEYNTNIKYEYAQHIQQLQSQIDTLHNNQSTVQQQYNNTISKLQQQINDLNSEIDTIKQYKPTQHIDTDIADRIDQIEKLLIVTDERTVTVQSTISKIASDILTRFDTYQNITAQQLHNLKSNVTQHNTALQQTADRLNTIEQNTKYRSANAQSDVVLSRLEEQIDIVQQQLDKQQHNTTVLIQQLLDKFNRTVTTKHTTHSDSTHQCDILCNEMIQQQKQLQTLLNAKLKLMDERIDDLRHRITDKQIRHNTHKSTQSATAIAEGFSDLEEHKAPSTVNPVKHVQPYIMYPAKLPSSESINHLERLVRTVDLLQSPEAVKTTKKHVTINDPTR